MNNFIALSFDNKKNSDNSKKAKNGVLIYLYLSSFYIHFFDFHRIPFENKTGHPRENCFRLYLRNFIENPKYDRSFSIFFTNVANKK